MAMTPHAQRPCLAGLRFRVQTFALSAALLLGWLSAPDAFAAAKLPEVAAPPAELGVPAFYRKFISAGGYPIVASERVNDYALKEAAFLVNQMLAQRPEVRATK